MKIIKLYEEFTNKTISINNDEYDKFLNKYKDENRSNIVAWTSPGSQEKNFKLVRQFINNGESLLDYGCGIGDFTQNLKENNIHLSNYLGVDINGKFINIAKETYPEYDFKTITSVDDVNGKWNNVCAIGVFTWYIEKEEFIQTIQKLYDLADKRLLLTVLDGDTPYDYLGGYDELDEKEYWTRQYRYYSKRLFKKLFPEYNIKFKSNVIKDTLLVIIEK